MSEESEDGGTDNTELLLIMGVLGFGVMIGTITGLTISDVGSDGQSPDPETRIIAENGNTTTFVVRHVETYDECRKRINHRKQWLSVKPGEQHNIWYVNRFSDSCIGVVVRERDRE